MTIKIKATEFETAGEAIRQAGLTAGDVAITLNGKNYVTNRGEADRLAAAGVEFAYLHYCQRSDGTRVIVTVPVN